MGHQNIGFINGPTRIHGWTSRKMGAMLETVNRLGAEHFSSRNAPSTENADIAATLREWYADGTMPEALILPAASTFLALEPVMLENGLSCPEDISIVTFGASHLGSSTLKLTHLDTFPRQIGIKAAQRLNQMLSFYHTDERPHKVIIPMEFIAGESVRNKTIS
jgi:DNA-binding LacI/PurR family transcriptional regulator